MNLTTKHADLVLFLKDEDMFYQIYELDTLRLFLVILSSVLTLLSILGALFATLFYSYLASWPDKLECLPLVGLSILV